MTTSKGFTRRDFIKTAGTGLFLAGVHLGLPLPAWAVSAGSGVRKATASNRYDLTVGYSPIRIDGRTGTATAVNGTVPGPLLHLREGDEVTLRVANQLMDSEHSSIHWHGILVPYQMDGVPGLSFSGIRPGDTYQYSFQVQQAGTYWYHSHSRFQEQTGTYGPLIIDPKDGEPFDYDRDYPVVLSDWSFEDPEAIYRHINLVSDYYNFQQRTLPELFKDIQERGLRNAVTERMAWANMRMSPVDLADVTAYTYTYLINGHSPDMNWTALFAPHETIRLRFINASTMTTFDVRIPGLDMEVVMADGMAVRPVRVHEFRIGVAETYDVLVRPSKDLAFTIFAESIDRSGYTRATLSPEPGRQAPVPKLRPRPVRGMEDMGMDHGAHGMDHGASEGNGQNGTHGMAHGDAHDRGQDDTHAMQSDDSHDMGGQNGSDHSMAHGSGSQEMAHSADLPGRAKSLDPRIPGNGPTPFSPPDRSNVAMVTNTPKYRLDEPGIGLGADGWRVLTYDDLVSAEPQPYADTVDREMTINITANMERFMFSFDGKKFSEHQGPYMFRYQERLRLYLVNHTMMEHPIHLHGMWMQLENGADKLPFKHTVLTKPGEVMSLLITPIEKGDWGFHCHLLYHMEAGMFQFMRVT
ncbi:MAG: hypothetical protein VR64_22520 [Desulfatitalea sp. BRH_c12]|nr:MAG: hypothetical protein VR64_22520 [Desulfatitalea sp. BRH_c12]